MGERMSLAGWRVTANTLVTTDDLVQCWGALTNLAKQGDTQALALWCRYTDIGRHIKAGALEASVDSIDWSLLESLDGCLTALSDIARAQERGDIDEKTAAGLRSSVEAAVRVHSAKAGGAVMQALGENPPGVVFLDAANPEESMREWADNSKPEGEPDD